MGFIAKRKHAERRRARRYGFPPTIRWHNLPPGLSGGFSGLLVGTPMQAGTFETVVSVTTRASEFAAARPIRSAPSLVGAALVAYAAVLNPGHARRRR